MSLRKLPEKQTEVGLRVLNGEKAARVAREFGVRAETAISYATKYVTSMQGYDSKEHFEVLAVPGSGHLKTARTLYKRILSRNKI